jgi:hypothetical protein
MIVDKRPYYLLIRAFFIAVRRSVVKGVSDIGVFLRAHFSLLFGGVFKVKIIFKLHKNSTVQGCKSALH